MSLKKTFVLSYSGIIGGVTIIAALSLWMNYYNQKLSQKQEQRYESYLLATSLRQSSDDLTRMARTYVQTGDPKYEKIYWDILAIRNGRKNRPQNYDRIYWDLVLNYGDKPHADSDQAVSLKVLMQEAGFSEEEFAKLQEAENNSNDLVKTETIAMNAVKGIFQDENGNFTKRGKPDFELARRIMSDATYHQNKAKIMQPIDEFLALLDERTQGEVIFYQKRADSVLQAIIVVSFSLGIFSIIIGIVVSRSILRQVGGEPSFAVATVQRITQGDLTQSFRHGTEENFSILGNMRTMQQQLAQVVHRVKNATLNIQAKSSDIDRMSLDMLQGVTTQATASEEVAVSTDRLFDNMTHHAQQSQEAAGVARNAAVRAQEAGKVMGEVIDATQEIANRIKVIEEITFQTHVLSLNASIEAAKSQEYGLGFAVIASEIRALAQRTQGAANQINQLARSSVNVAENAGKTILDLVAEIERTADLVERISVATIEQTGSSEQINLAIQQLKTVVDENRHVASNLRAMAETFALESNNLAETMNFFKVTRDTRR